MAAHRYWRILITASAAGAFCAFSEIQFRTSAGVSLPFSGGTPSADSFYSLGPNFPASQGSDGNTATAWLSGNGVAMPHWWEYDYGAGNALAIVEIAITARTDANFNQTPSTFTPQWSDNGSTWHSMSQISTASWTALGQVQTFAVSALPSSPIWNPDDLLNITLSNAYLTATATSLAIGSVRSANQQSTGKFYWEYTLTTFVGNANVGVMSATFPLGSYFSTATVGSAGVVNTGIVYSDGVSSGLNIGTLTTGSVVCIAIDCSARLIWCRLGAAGNWNGSGTANPATGTGGVSISLGGSVPVYAAMVGYNGDAVTANFGGSAFTGAVPSGFTAGFPVLVTSAQAMVMA
jgi:F5/8 type C domain